jgi:hypothetical protein
MLRAKDLIYLLSILAFCLVSFANAQFYRWVDDTGTIHYSDKLPPTESQREQDLLNDQGRLVKNIPAPKTEGQIEEDEHLAKLEIEKNEKLEKSIQRDHLLLALYLNVEDIERLRDERIETVESAIKITKIRKIKFTKKLDDLYASENRFATTGQNIPPWLIKSREHYHEQLANVEDILAIKEREKLNIKQRFADDINRYLELKALKSAAE